MSFDECIYGITITTETDSITPQSSLELLWTQSTPFRKPRQPYFVESQIHGIKTMYIFVWLM